MHMTNITLTAIRIRLQAERSWVPLPTVSPCKPLAGPEEDGTHHHPRTTGQVGPVLGSEAPVGPLVGVHQELPDGHRARAPLQHAAPLGEGDHLGEGGGG